MNCEKCSAPIVVAPNLFGKVVTFHQVPSLIEGYVTHIEIACN